MPIPWKLSRWVQRTLPGFLLKPLRAVYSVYFVWATNKRFARQRALIPRVFPTQPAKVLFGPFKGMNYVDESLCSMLIPKLIGCYEEELAGAIEEIAAGGYGEVLNIGCAEGYYAVGLALRSPKSKVYAFDIDPPAEQLCLRMARLNDVENRVVFSGGCDPGKLKSMLRDNAVIVCDIEGYELELLDPAKVPKLATTDMLVELHGATDPKISIRDILIKRFEATHDCRIITVTGRDPARYYPALENLNQKEKVLAITEFRSGTMEWGWWRARRK